MNCDVRVAVHVVGILNSLQQQSDYKVEQPSFTLIALFWLEIGRCRGRNWLNENQ